LKRTKSGFCRKKYLFNQKKQIFLGEKAFLFKTEMEISTIQDGGNNLNWGSDMAYSKFGPNMNYDELE